MRCDSFQAYCNAVRDTFFPVEFRLKSEVTGDFFSRFEMSRFGAFDLTRAFVKAKSTGHRGRNLLAPKAPDQFVLNIVRSGLVRQTQFGRKIETPSGYMCLVDSRSPFDTEQLMTTDALYIRIPGAPLRAAIGTPEDFCAIPIDLRSGLGAIFGGFLFSAWRERDRLAEEDRDVVAERMIDIFRSICGKLDNRRLSSITSMGTQIFERAGRFIEANLGDPQLNPDRVAKSLRISRSHLHASFCGSGQTVGQTILSKRLERCHHLLANPQLAHRKITDIAFDCGFNDAAHFSRTFKAQFGVSPRAFRRQKLAAIPA